MSLGPPSLVSAPQSARSGSISLRLDSVDLVRLAASTLEPLEEEARGRDVTLTIDAPPRLDRIAVDPEKTTLSATR
jgi:hypothetical protein